MSNHEERSHIVNTTFDGNHLNRPMEFSGYSRVEPLVKCPNCECSTTKQRIESTGKCEQCEDKFWEDYKNGR